MIKRFADFLVYSNVWIALGSALMCLPFYRLLNSVPNQIILLFTCSATGFVYTYQRFVKLKSGQPFSNERRQWMLANGRMVWLVLFVSGSGALLCMFYLKTSTLIALIPAGLVSFLYVYSHQKFEGLRHIPYLKALVVSLVWTFMAVVVPRLELNVVISNDWVYYALAFFLFVLAVAIVFDQRDILIDDVTLQTFPQIFGLRNNVRLSLCFTYLAYAIILLLRPTWFLGVTAIAITSSMLINKSIQQKDDFYYSFWMDGLLLIIGLISLL